ncbi:potassium channel subfamily K member 16-like [Lacerta agilis]|uniref:potassium channel subfamily K member 16-like n=1 Tax=Lacerta agilis TaxID=80427 RepID=UPI00141A548E|nr:potassium channel subfamily K member 16-like [Lacerta agilis]
MRFNSLQGTILLAGFVTYVVMGALVFEILEKENHQKLQDGMFHLKEDFFLNYTKLTPAEVESFLAKLVEYLQMGIYPIETHAENVESSWDFVNSFYFVGTVLSTIGYGHISPRTKEGQIFCVIFALFGVPFCLICLNYIGFLVSRLFQCCAKILCGKGNKKSPRYMLLFMLLGVIMFVILPSFLFKWVEAWTYQESVYYTFITLTTIGFGDYLIGRKYDRPYFWGYRMIAAAWITFGLAWISVLFQIVSALLAPANPQRKRRR